MGLSPVLVTEPQFLNDRAVRVDIRTPQIVQKSATLAYHLQEAAATVVIFAVLAEMIREVIDALGQNRDLNSGRTGVAFVRPVFFNCGCFIKRHCFETA